MPTAIDPAQAATAPERASPVPSFWPPDASLGERLAELHTEIRQQPGLHPLGRIAVARYDAAGSRLATFLASGDPVNPVEHFAAPLADFPRLRAALWSGQDLVENDIPGGRGLAHPDGRLRRDGYRSRYVAPILEDGRPFGLLFFNARQPGFFSAEVVLSLKPYRHLIGHVVVTEAGRLRAMLATAQVAREISHYRDDETGGHLERMAAYARLIAGTLAPRLGLSDEFVELIGQFAPLHDIGKVAIPDSILLKPGKLTAEEYAVMQTHVVRGVEIVDHIAGVHQMQSSPYVRMLRNIVACHHEALDGSGYPHGLSGSALPWEGRIVTVADVFDALTSARPYKAPWSNEEALAHLRALAGTRFDPLCVEALAGHAAEVARIQERLA